MFPDCTFVGKCYFSHNKVFLIATEMVYCWTESINRSRKQSWVTFSSVQLLSCVQLFATPWTAALQASLSITNSRACSNSCPSGGDAVQPSHLLSSPSPPAFNLSQHQDLSNESVFHIRWPKYWSFSFSISPSNEYSGLFSFRIDWFDLLAVQETFKSLLQHHSSKASYSLALSLLYGSALTSIHDYWKNHGFDYTDLCRQSDISAFQMVFGLLCSDPSEKVLFMAAVGLEIYFLNYKTWKLKRLLDPGLQDVVLLGKKTAFVSLSISIRALGWSGTLSERGDVLNGIFSEQHESAV